IDLSCGFQSYLPAGTSCNARRERSTSRFISLSKNSVRFIRVLLLLVELTRGVSHMYDTKKMSLLKVARWEFECRISFRASCKTQLLILPKLQLGVRGDSEK